MAQMNIFSIFIVIFHIWALNEKTKLRSSFLWLIRFNIDVPKEEIVSIMFKHKRVKNQKGNFHSNIRQMWVYDSVGDRHSILIWLIKVYLTTRGCHEHYSVALIKSKGLSVQKWKFFARILKKCEFLSSISLINLKTLLHHEVAKCNCHSTRILTQNYCAVC